MHQMEDVSRLEAFLRKQASVTVMKLVCCRDVPVTGIGIGWYGAKKGVSVSVVEHEY